MELYSLWLFNSIQFNSIQFYWPKKEIQCVYMQCIIKMTLEDQRKNRSINMHKYYYRKTGA